MLVLKRFSSLEEQRDFARRDYEGLNEAGKEALRQRRNAYANELRNNYRKTMRDINFQAMDMPSNAKEIKTKHNGCLDITCSGRGKDHLIKSHKKNVTETMLENSSIAKQKMKNEILASTKKASTPQVNPNLLPQVVETKPSAAPAVTNAAKGGSKAVTKNSGKLLKRAGIGALAVGGTAGLAYGAKKLYDKKKKAQAE